MSFLFFYPNRPILVPPDPVNPLDPSRDYLDSLEAENRWLAEQKWNGDNTLIYIENGKFTFWNRHRESLHYQPPEEVLEELRRWPDNSILNCETVNSKTKAVKNLLIVHCVMAWKGELLVGKTWGDSRALLEESISQGLSGEYVQVSKVWQRGFWDLYQAADGVIIEGIILKDPAGKLIFSTCPIDEVYWMRKIRKPSRKYAF